MVTSGVSLIKNGVEDRVYHELLYFQKIAKLKLISQMEFEEICSFFDNILPGIEYGRCIELYGRIVEERKESENAP